MVAGTFIIDFIYYEIKDAFKEYSNRYEFTANGVFHLILHLLARNVESILATTAITNTIFLI